MGGRDGEVIEQRGGRASLARGTPGALNAKLEGPVWPDRKESGHSLSLAMLQRWGSIGEGSGGVELEGSAPKEAGSARGRKSTELQVMAGLPASTSGLAGNLGQATPPLPHLAQLSGRLNACERGHAVRNS